MKNRPMWVFLLTWFAFLMIIAALLPGCAHQDEWTRRDTIMYSATSAVIVADAITTNRIADCYNCYESGPVAKHFLGSQPATRDVALYFGSVIVLNYVVARALPSKWRPYWFSWEIATHGYAVINNCDIGLC